MLRKRVNTAWWMLIICSIPLICHTVQGNAAIESNGDSLSRPDPIVTETRVPGTPGSIRARATDFSITVQWTPPKNNSILVSNYIINYGERIPDEASHSVDGKQRHYTILNLQPNTDYVISLRAENRMGPGQPIYVQLRTKSGKDEEEEESVLLPPVGLRAEVHSDTMIILSWSDAGLTRKKESKDRRVYQIQFAAGGGRYRHRNTSEQQAVFDGLRPATRYEFSVRIIKGSRESPWSLVAENITEESSPTSAPRDVTIIPHEEDSTILTVSWQPPKRGNGKITGYVIMYTSDERQKKNWVREAVLGDRLSKTVHGFEPDTNYYFRVEARNRKGKSPPSVTVVRRTGPANSISTVPMTYIILTCVGVFLLSLLMASVVFILCREKRKSSRRRRSLSNASDKKEKKSFIKQSSGQGGLNPPDLWIHHEQLELRSPLHEGGSGRPSPNDPEDDRRVSLSSAVIKERKHFSHISAGSSALGDQSYESIPPSLSQSIPTATVASVHPIPVHTVSATPHMQNSWASSIPGLPQNQPASYSLVSHLQLNQYGLNANMSHPEPCHSPSLSSSASAASDSHSSNQMGTSSTTLCPQGSQDVAPLKSFSHVFPNNSSILTSPSSSTASLSYKASPAPVISSPQLLLGNTLTSSPFKRIGMVAPNQQINITSNQVYDNSLLKPSLHSIHSSEELSAEMANLDGLMRDLNASSTPVGSSKQYEF